MVVEDASEFAVCRVEWVTGLQGWTNGGQVGRRLVSEGAGRVWGMDDERLAGRWMVRGRVRFSCLGWLAVGCVGVLVLVGGVGGAESGQFVVPGERGEPGWEFGYWDLFVADEAGYHFGFAERPGVLGGEDADGNPTTMAADAGLTQTGTDTAFVTSSGAIYSFSETTSFRVDYAKVASEPVASVVFQTLTGGRRFELENIRLNYTTVGGEVVSLAPRLKGLDDPQTGAFAERLVSAFQWDLIGRDVQSFRLVFGAPGSSMPLWEAQLDVARGGDFVPVLGYVLIPRSLPVVRFQAAGRVIPVVAAGAETRFFRPGTTVRLAGVPTAGFASAGWVVDGAVVEQALLDVVFGEADAVVAAVFAPLSYGTWRTHWFDHANAILGLPADHLNDDVSGPEADPDGDGAKNFAEFAFGGDPYVPDAGNRSLEVSDAISGSGEGGPRLTYRRPASDAAMIDYVLQGSSDLRGWEPVGAVVESRELEPTGYWRLTVREVTGEGAAPHPFLRLTASVRP